MREVGGVRMIIKHFAFVKDGEFRYLCNQACGTIEEKRTNDYFQVTCKNCKNILNKDRVKFAKKGEEVKNG